jgi:hypothetical protein
MSLKWDRLGKFVNGIAATSELLQRAAKQGFFFEYVCLASNVIDANLRIGIILRHQIRTKSREIPLRYLFQQEGKERLSEREIYRISRDDAVIDDAMFRELNVLYDERNRVIHRYIIADLSTNAVLDVGIKYETLLQKVQARIYEVEEQQIKLGVGMTVTGPAFEGPEVETWLRDMADAKHDSSLLSDRIRSKSA